MTTSPAAAVDENALYRNALAFVLAERNASTSFVQRKLQIGYNRAATLIERMEREGHIGPANHVGKRDILSTGLPAETEPAETEAAPAAPAVPAEPAPEPTSAPAPEPEPAGEPRLFICSGCDLETTSTRDIPKGWYTQTSGRLGVLLRCPACAQKNATRIATEHLTTEEILAGKPINDDGSAISSDDVITGAAQSRLRTIIERCQRLLEDGSVIRNDLKEVLTEAKGEGFDVKIIRRLLSELQKDKVKRQEEAALLDLYASAIGIEL